ncbi:helix-turn-helix domain-containing protein [Rhizobium sp. BR 314]|uniref:helix-turn-helix domain-containing protein n=1 Tax=Rhizobium sp. BR 314 TaxID=3040013 RepID=UPI0039BF1690
MAAFGRELRRLRIDRGWSLQRMAAESGVSVAGIQKIESGTTSSPNLQTAVNLCEALGQELTDLVTAACAVKTSIDVVTGTAAATAHGLTDLTEDLSERRLQSLVIALGTERDFELTDILPPSFMYVLQGQVTARFQSGRVVRLDAHDAIHLREELPLRLERAGESAVVVLLVSDKGLE